MVHPIKKRHSRLHHRRSGAIALLVAGGLVAGGLCAGTTGAQAAGLLQPAGAGETLTLVDHEVNVIVEDGYAITTIDQRFANSNARDLEAIYSFPVPKAGAVSEFTYWINGKPISGEVLEKQKARQVYETEKSAGREAGLAEQDGHKTFDIAVTPVRAGQDVRIRLAYIQPARMDAGIGRYVYPLQDGTVDDQRAAFWTMNETVTGRFAFDMALKLDYPVNAVRLPAHPNAAITKVADGHWTIHIDNQPLATPNDKKAPAGPSDDDFTTTHGQAQTIAATPARLDTDVVVYWRETPGTPARVDMTAHKASDKARGTFMLTLTPGLDLQPITGGTDWVIVLDKSGSMRSKWSTVIDGIEGALRDLRPDDRFRVITFDQTASDVFGGFRGTEPAALENAVSTIRAIQPDNSTNLFEGLERGLAAADADRPTGLILITDGVANVGKTATKNFVDLVRKQDLRLFTIVMGNSANVPLLSGMTKVSGGTAIAVSNSDDVLGAILKAKNKLTHQALHGLNVSVTGTSGALRLSDINDADIRSLYHGEQMTLFGRYSGEGTAKLTLEGKISGQAKTYSTDITFPAAQTRNPELERLWAYAEIERDLFEIALLGENADIKQNVVDLSMQYGIVTPYTSMVVLRDDRFADLGIARTNAKRLETEAAAAKTRGQSAIANRRVDSQAPMFQAKPPRSRTQSSGGGSGDVGLLGLAMTGLAGFGALYWRRRRAA